MSDTTRDYSELRREVLEGRNQAIKTDNQLKNLILDIKHFEKRFDGLEKRVRVAGIGVNLIIVATVVLAAFTVIMIRAQSVADELAGLRRQVAEAQSTGRAKLTELERQLAQKELTQAKYSSAAQVALRTLDLLEAHQESEAGAMLVTLDFTALSALEQRIVQSRLAGLRQRQAEMTYRAGRLAMNQGRFEEATVELQRALALDPQGRLSGQARYQLASSLYTLRRYTEAVPLYREISKNEVRSIADEGLFFAGASEIRAGRLVEGKALLAQVVQSGGRYAAAAAQYISAVEQKTDLPADTVTSRMRPSRLSRTPDATMPAPSVPKEPSTGETSPPPSDS